MTRFTGIIPPLCTPFRDDFTIDVDSLRRHLDVQLDAGVHGVFVLGSSSEVAFLPDRQRRVVIETTVEHVGGRVPVLAGCIDMTTLRVAEHIRVAEEAGADALVITAPYYTRTHTAEIEQHFRLLHERASLPIFAYDIPVAVHSKLDRDMVLRLAADGVLAGLKDSSGDEAGFGALLLDRRERGLSEFAVFTGSELVVDLALQMGADGAVPGLANVDPAGYVTIWDRFRAGDFAAARREQDRLMRLYDITCAAPPERMGRGSAGLGAFKAAMKMRGFIDNSVMAPPQLPLNDEELLRIKGALTEAGLL
ncbi:MULTISPECIES: dihydrodipicolinate synthase family protein [Amycolatopsis]|uniref:Dihydrodipicolinate synthase family protein n=1 Tax=Amycolatopsis thermalba TaxID=944492 RepID=A0ABY4P2T1_9PSEU|nr:MULTISPECIES: dihydrodipicolinate synthase family protein [Amycolatopsis]OXM73726.1 dihydrodipicolinate synthase family protein [Amycolatopsis sp. KNN50.9b]UQS26662.1 dihydrodipicolinate synthase family protein [Amycolatopsis thermalba]